MNTIPTSKRATVKASRKAALAEGAARRRAKRTSRAARKRAAGGAA